MTRWCPRWHTVPGEPVTGPRRSRCARADSINLNELTGVTVLSGNDAWASGSEGNVKPWARRPRPAEAVSPPTAAAGRGEVTGFALVAGPVAQNHPSAARGPGGCR